MCIFEHVGYYSKAFLSHKVKQRREVKKKMNKQNSQLVSGRRADTNVCVYTNKNREKQKLKKNVIFNNCVRVSYRHHLCYIYKNMCNIHLCLAFALKSNVKIK